MNKQKLSEIRIFLDQIIIQPEAIWIQNVKWDGMTLSGIKVCLVRQEFVEFRRGGFDNL